MNTCSPSTSQMENSTQSLGSSSSSSVCPSISLWVSQKTLWLTPACWTWTLPKEPRWNNQHKSISPNTRRIAHVSSSVVETDLARGFKESSGAQPHTLGQNITVTGVWLRVALHLTADSKQRAENRNRLGMRQHKNMGPVTNIFQLGSTSYSFQNIPN